MLQTRSLSARLLAIASGVSFTLLLFYYNHARISSHLRSFSDTLWEDSPVAATVGTCSPDAYASGYWKWSPKTEVAIDNITTKDDALAFTGFQGCAADREYYWHLGADVEEKWDRFPDVDYYDWVPGDGCDIRPMRPRDMVRDMVEKGGWLILGDSITENHFFSLSCILYPHVRATPNYTENPYFDRAWPQNLYLNPSSPLVQELDIPYDFDIESTPLATFRRVDLLLSRPELEKLYKETYPDKAETTPLFSEEQTWSISPQQYMPLFLSLPYSTLIVSTAGHWTTTLMSAFRNESIGEKDGYGIQDVLEFFEVSMQQWADDVQSALVSYYNSDEGGGDQWTFGALHYDAPSDTWRVAGMDDDWTLASMRALPYAPALARTEGSVARDKRVVVRAYLPGHEDCHNFYQPWWRIKPFQFQWYNWAWIKDFNQIFQNLLTPQMYPFIHYLPIDRPARLRPDAHATGDCLHLMSGTGVLEGWSHYIWHYVTTELEEGKP
ncbi:hypothetical protein CONPUDRAFT_122139 [Coniophora puteana RWD-64-598 SS2]|uniref:Uncharacterized protein n=1 Tax=Coniophora puteana (strain RWD-64-598) TaxID=741705 RepID=A0A5M3MY44_CONPW|nr:uncharacterized protein CONPUDRAFT_122139 [Coniophora puteana RWD-64-598 SS2]EIW83551.1 hypothetical protein CONPUDRAFT_122139 [Coniophora puteana RWD-64-598 SS2]